MTSLKQSLSPICLIVTILLHSALSSPTKSINEIPPQRRPTPEEFFGAVELGHRQKGDKLMKDEKVEIVDDIQGQVFRIPNGYELTQLRVVPPGFFGVEMDSPFVPAKVVVKVRIVPPESFKGSLKGHHYWIEMYGKPIECKDGGNQCKKDVARWAEANFGINNA